MNSAIINFTAYTGHEYMSGDFLIIEVYKNAYMVFKEVLEIGLTVHLYANEYYFMYPHLVAACKNAYDYLIGTGMEDQEIATNVKVKEININEEM